MQRLARKSIRCCLLNLTSATNQSMQLLSSLEKLILPRHIPFSLFELVQFHPYRSSRILHSLIAPYLRFTSCSETGKRAQPINFYVSTGCESSCSVQSDRNFVSSGIGRSQDISYCFNIHERERRISRVDLSTPSRHWLIRSFSASPMPGFRRLNKRRVDDSLDVGATAKHVSRIIDLIMNGETDFDSKLNGTDEKLSVSSLVEILLVLNSVKVFAFPFFDWVRCSHPELFWNSEICSLLVDNCGRLGNFGAARCILKGMSEKNVKLTGKAFRFLPVMSSSEISVSQAVEDVLALLNEVGGSARASGIPALIEMYIMLGFSGIARRIITGTRRKTSHYNILIKEMCGRGDFNGAKDLLSEMKQMGCDPNIQTYNLIVSHLCKNHKVAEACRLVEHMQERGCSPDELTYEILICCLCRQGKMDLASSLLHKISLRGLEPRLAAHRAIIQGYFYSQQHRIAHKYVQLSSDKYRCSSNKMYSVLASLHQKTGNPTTAQDILSQMMRKGLRPIFVVYKQVLRNLYGSGRNDLAKDLEKSFHNMNLQPISKK